MPLFNSESRLCDALFCDASLIPLVERFGISLGIGDASIEDVCVERQINIDFFLAMINTFLNEDYFPENIERYFDIPMIIDFLSNTNRFYSSTQLPNIERHFKYLIERSGTDNNLDHIYKFFLEVKADLLQCDENDELVWFPAILQRNNDTIYPNPHYLTDGNITDCLPDQIGRTFTDRDSVEEKIGDLESLFIMHIDGDYDKTLALAVVNAIYMLHKDMRQNNRIRNRILLPATASIFL